MVDVRIRALVHIFDSVVALFGVSNSDEYESKKRQVRCPRTDAASGVALSSASTVDL